MLRRRTTRAAEPALPDADLMARVTGTEDPEWFVETGRRTIADFVRALGVVDQKITDHHRVLDFGCGCGRVLLRLGDVAGEVELHGVDIDPDAIAWTQRNIPWATTHCGGHLPPLPFDDGFFELVVNHSVFTHLPEDYQDAWLAELGRITAPGATLLLTVNGMHGFGEFVRTHREAGGDPSPFESTMREHGLLYIADDGWVGSTFPDFYHSTFHTPAYVFEHWGRYFDIRAYIARGALDYQDMVVLKHPA